MSVDPPQENNVLGGPLLVCGYDPLTGYFRDGCCAKHGAAGVAHLVCVRVTAEFLEFSRDKGNDLSTPIPEMHFRGFQPGDRWCLCTYCAGSKPGRLAERPKSCLRPRTKTCSGTPRSRRSNGTPSTCIEPVSIVAYGF